MILLSDIRDFVATLGIAEDEYCYSGKMADKADKSIGTYPLKSGRSVDIPIGGLENKSYSTKAISFLVHWNTSQRETEVAAVQLYEKLQATKNVTVNGHTIKFVQMSHEEPVSVDTDEYGIYEYVIECLFYFDKEE